MCGSGSVFRIRIRIQQAPEYGSNTDPDPQHCSAVWSATNEPPPNLIFTGGMRWSCSAAEVIFSNRLFSTFFSLGKVIPVVRGWGAHQPGLDFLIGTWRRYPIGLFPIVRSWAELVPDVQVLSRSSELMIKDPSVRMLFTIPDPHYGKPPGSGSAWRMRIRIQGNKRIQILAINGSRRK